MANPVCKVLLTDAPLQAPPGTHYGSGAIVDFFGTVRPLEDGREISGIDYEANQSMASHQMERITRDAIQKFNLDGAVVHHRLGFVPAGQASVFVRTTSRNRAEAYRANQWMMDELKTRVPIWKRPKFITVAPASTAQKESVSSR
ncbi:MAG TPA: molybdenum cofactor biosynthesis protein MoaE [Chthoniobacterales bacterium]|nr:molybdenum cofactor biosynthesis protein MoaE [Chthoniobacterales bacterium]